MLGQAQLQSGHYPEAAAAYRHATERSRGTADYWVGLGHALAMSQDDAGALAAYAEVLELDPSRFNIDYNIGILLVRRGDVSAAAAKFREALRIQPDYEPARIALDELSPSR